jgi:hypothetical protein
MITSRCAKEVLRIIERLRAPAIEGEWSMVPRGGDITTIAFSSTPSPKTGIGHGGICPWQTRRSIDTLANADWLVVIG